MNLRPNSTFAQEQLKLRASFKPKYPSAYVASSFASDVPELLDLLAAGVPPGQIRDRNTGEFREAGLAAVLNAAFVFQSSHIGDLWTLVQADDDDSKTRARLKLDELLLKAIELNEVAFAWRLAAK